MSVKPIEVRFGLEHDGPKYDLGLNCNFDPHTGEEIESMTKQSFVEECDINYIMARYETTGEFPQKYADKVGTGQFGDFTNVPDFQTALQTVMDAEEMFGNLPAKVRDRFGNDPQQMFDFLSDGKNREEAIKLGLVPPPAPEPGPQKVEIVNPSTPPASSPASPGAPTPPKPSSA